jgi:hypothetical protein
VADLASRGELLHHAPEGVRSPTQLLTSRALAGTLEPSALAACDSAGVGEPSAGGFSYAVALCRARHLRGPYAAPTRP